MKKLISLALALVLILSLSVTAFADGDEPDTPSTPSITVGDKTYDDITSVIITKIYEAENSGTTSPAETFTLVQVGNGTVNDGDASAAPDLIDIDKDTAGIQVASVTYDQGDAGGSNKTKNFTVSLPEYTTVGIYAYTLRENASTNAGVVTHTGDIRLVVTVMQGDNGKVRVAGVHTEAVDSDVKTGSITNTYKAGSLSIKKTVSGNMADSDKFFEFTVTLTGEQGKTYLQSYAISGGSYSNNPTSAAIGTPFKVYLKANDTITIANLPYGVTYTVDETTYNDYTTTGEVLQAKTISGASVTETINNDKSGTVDTGITLDSLPFVLILAVCAGAVVLFVIKRRNSVEF